MLTVPMSVPLLPHPCGNDAQARPKKGLYVLWSTDMVSIGMVFRFLKGSARCRQSRPCRERCEP